MPHIWIVDEIVVLYNIEGGGHFHIFRILIHLSFKLHT